MGIEMPPGNDSGGAPLRSPFSQLGRWDQQVTTGAKETSWSLMPTSALSAD